MAKLSKIKINNHEMACDILKRDKLSEDDKLFVLSNWNPQAEFHVSKIGAFFTPIDLSRAFSIEVSGFSKNTLVDVCAGIGSLAYHVYRANWGEAKIICVEKNPRFVEVGKKILPEAIWICGDVLDPEIWDIIGDYDYAFGNPPFGTNISNDRAEWTGHISTHFEFKAMAAALTRSRLGGVFIVPATSANFRLSGVKSYRAEPNEKCDAFTRDTKWRISANCGIDTSEFLSQWEGVKLPVEIIVVSEE